MTRYYLAGHKGMVGAAMMRRLRDRGADVITRDRGELDLCDQAATRAFMQDERPDVVILAAAKVGGILANADHPANFIYDNLIIETNVIHEAWRSGVQRLLFLGSSCIYPRLAPQPITEEALLAGPLEPTNEPYAIAKIAGLKLCEAYNRQHGTDYRCVMPTNLYGPGDNFHPNESHVLPALLRRFHDATRSDSPEVTVWGSGTPRREFLHVDDMAEASLFVLDADRAHYETHTGPGINHLNVGVGSDISIAELAGFLAEVTGFRGRILFDTTKPDGTPRKLLDVSRLTSMGWQAGTDLQTGIAGTYEWFCRNEPHLRS
jgi:nucleoside-diphosphate-sugar epimerase